MAVQLRKNAKIARKISRLFVRGKKGFVFLVEILQRSTTEKG